MKILLFGATGNVGRCIAKEALNRGHQVIGVVRDPAAFSTPDPRMTLRRGDATDRRSVAALASEADAVVSAISPRPNARGLAAPTLVAAARAVIAGLREAGTKRVIAVGGAGSLEVAPGKALVDEPGFPDAYKAEALDGRESLNIYREDGGGLDWTFICPAIEIGPGERKGRYRTTANTVLMDAGGKSFITFEDLAVAILDELEIPKHVGRRFGVAY
jgi:putative NADH-flavin reductase